MYVHKYVHRILHDTFIVISSTYIVSVTYAPNLVAPMPPGHDRTKVGSQYSDTGLNNPVEK